MKTIKQNILFVSILSLLAGGICVLAPNLGEAQVLSSNIMRRVNAANEYLDKAEKQIRTGNVELAPRQIKGAQQQYDEIFTYFSGSFDPAHPMITTLKQRISAVQADMSGAKNPAPETTQAATTPPSNPNDLSSNIRRRIAEADRKLIIVNQRAKTGNRAIGELDAANGSYESIFEYYKGTFDPNHPDILALKERIDQAEQAMNNAYAKRLSSTPIEQDNNTVAGLPEPMGNGLIDIAGTLRTFEQRLKTATGSSNPASYLPGLNDDLKIAQGKFSGLNSKYSAQIDPTHAAYLQVQTRLANAETAVATLTGKGYGVQT